MHRFAHAHTCILAIQNVALEGGEGGEVDIEGGAVGGAKCKGEGKV